MFFLLILFSNYLLLDFFLFIFLFRLFIFNYSGCYLFSSFLVLDKVSFLLCILTLWVLLLLLKVSLKYKNSFPLFLSFKKVACLLSLLLVYTFCFYRVLGFYVFFEVSLLPLLFLIIGWGYQVERLQASFYLFIYTVVGSLPFFLSILFIYFSLSLSLIIGRWDDYL